MTRDKAEKLFDSAIAQLLAISVDTELDRDKIAALKIVAYYSYKVTTESQNEYEAAKELNELKARLSRLATQRLAKSQLSLLDEDSNPQSVN